MPVSSANFGFAKLLSMPFFGSGIMDFPIGGFKKPRNSGKTSLHVFVHSGKVWVKVGGTKGASTNLFRRSEGTEGNEFMVSRGGSFHVPRGELSVLLVLLDVCLMSCYGCVWMVSISYISLCYCNIGVRGLAKELGSQVLACLLVYATARREEENCLSRLAAESMSPLGTAGSELATASRDCHNSLRVGDACLGFQLMAQRTAVGCYVM